MKRVVAVLLVVVMVIGIGAAAADEKLSKYFEEVQGLANMRLKQVKSEYEKKGTLTDAQIEMAYAYLKMKFAAEMVSTVERFYPLSSYFGMGNDANTSMESIMDSMWLEVVKGEGDKDDFVKKLMAILEVYAE